MRGALRILGVIVLAAVAATAAHARSLRDDFPEVARLTGLEGGAAFDALADAIADTAARNLPVISASAGFTYTYNPDLEVFERTSDTLGPIFLERPDTLGRGKFNVNLSYQRVDLDEYDGDDADSLQAPDPLVATTLDATGTPIGRTANRLVYDMSLVNHIVAFSFTYGVLDNLDVNLLLPVIWTVFDLKATRQIVGNADVGGGFTSTNGPTFVGTTDDTKTGVGDILLRGKYQLPRCGLLRSAAGLQFRLPSGNEDNLQGTGTFEASPFLYGSAVFWDRVEPHANAGFDLRADDVARSQARYGAGVDVDLTDRVGLALDFLGRSQFEGSAEEGDTLFPHLTSNGVQDRPLLGLDFDRKDYFDFSFGMRAVVWRELMLFANGIYAINDEGLRSSSIIPTVGVEGTF